MERVAGFGAVVGSNPAGVGVSLIHVEAGGAKRRPEHSRTILHSTVPLQVEFGGERSGSEVGALEGCSCNFGQCWISCRTHRNVCVIG